MYVNPWLAFTGKQLHFQIPTMANVNKKVRSISYFIIIYTL